MADDHALHTGTELVKPAIVDAAGLLARYGLALGDANSVVVGPTRWSPEGAMVTIVGHNGS